MYVSVSVNVFVYVCMSVCVWRCYYKNTIVSKTFKQYLLFPETVELSSTYECVCECYSERTSARFARSGVRAFFKYLKESWNHLESILYHLGCLGSSSKLLEGSWRVLGGS